LFVPGKDANLPTLTCCRRSNATALKPVYINCQRKETTTPPATAVDTFILADPLLRTEEIERDSSSVCSSGALPVGFFVDLTILGALVLDFGSLAGDISVEATLRVGDFVDEDASF